MSKPSFLAINTKKLSRLEVINQTGRVFTQMPCKVELSIQDEGRTLKVFLTPTVGEVKK